MNQQESWEHTKAQIIDKLNQVAWAKYWSVSFETSVEPASAPGSFRITISGHLTNGHLLPAQPPNLETP